MLMMPCLSRLVWRSSCFQLLYSGFAHFVFEKKKEEEITAGGLYPWTIPIAITMATCARNCSYCRRQRMYSSTGSIPFAVSQIIIQRKAIGVIKLLTLPWHWSSYDWRSSGMILCTIWSSLARRLFPTTLFVVNSNKCCHSKHNAPSFGTCFLWWKQCLRPKSWSFSSLPAGLNSCSKIMQIRYHRSTEAEASNNGQMKSYTLLHFYCRQMMKKNNPCCCCAWIFLVKAINVMREEERGNLT